MSRLEGAAGKRIPLAGVMLVVMFAAAAGYQLRHAQPKYLDSAVVVFSLPRAQRSVNAYSWHVASLITSSEAMIQIMMSPQSARSIRAAGGTADYDIALVNLYNEDYPDYGYPEATLTSVSPSPEPAHRTFMAASRLLDRLLAARQAQAAVPPRERISAQVIGETGPIVQTGSAKRVLGGLALLAVVAASTVWGAARRPGARRTPARSAGLGAARPVREDG